MSCLAAQFGPMRFSDNVNQLQRINNVRKSSVGAQLKRVIDLLREKSQALDADQINEECYVDLKANKAVFNSLKNNPVVKYDGLRFSYKPNPNVVEDDMAFPNDPKIPFIKVDDDVKKLFREIVLPRDMIDIEKDLRKNGMKPSTNTAKRVQALGVQSMPETKKKKEHRITKRTKLTNPHFMHLFET